MAVRMYSLLRRLAVLCGAAFLFWSCAGDQSKQDTFKAAGGQSAGNQAGQASRAGADIGGPQAKPGEIREQFDTDDDGKPDSWKFFIKDASGKKVLTRREVDLNHDGKVDMRRIYDSKGKIEREELDLDFDGKIDVVSYYRGGELVKQEQSFSFDGKPTAWKYFDKGQVQRIERDTTNNGKVDTWEYYKNGKLTRLGIDTDGDGNVDKWETYEKKSKKKPPSLLPRHRPLLPNPRLQVERKSRTRCLRKHFPVFSQYRRATGMIARPFRETGRILLAPGQHHRMTQD
ncbi:MAG: hypothetical protein GXP49_01980 [Deltaproteobacteria bacterium]|nr:hypothetical protein [Deltaproteobacteria bacterium]